MSHNKNHTSNNDTRLERRTFGKVALAGALGAGAMLTKSERAQGQASGSPGNKWSATGRKMGVSHQRPANLTPGHLNYLKQMGVEYLEVRIPEENSSYDDIMDVREKVEGAGLKVFEIMLQRMYSSHEFALALPGRDEEIKFFQRWIKDLGKAGIDTTTYAWHTGGAYRTGYTTTRGCKTREFTLEAALSQPNDNDHVYSDEEMWANYEYFIKHVLPVAEDAGVRLQLHPNDPPVNHRGVARIFRSVEGFQRAMAIANHSPYSGILFCTGSFGQMFGPEGEGENVEQAIRDFCAKGQIYQVHYRNVSSHMPDFYETFPDNGYQNMYRFMKALGESNFNGIVCPDHVPVPEKSDADKQTAEAYIFGYIRAMIQAVDTELGLMA
jgi:mannonate dehydratase